MTLLGRLATIGLLLYFSPLACARDRQEVPPCRVDGDCAQDRRCDQEHRCIIGQRCPVVVCAAACPRGFQSNNAGCPSCECQPLDPADPG